MSHSYSSRNIARDTMHQQQWLAVIEELGGLEQQLPMPNSNPPASEHKEFAQKEQTTSANGVLGTIKHALTGEA